jgi:two-component system chemotaxis response regulator CheB
MFSTLTEHGAEITLEALSLGASDYMTKPTNSASLAASMEEVRRELTAKVLSLARRPGDAENPLPKAPTNNPRIGKTPIEILAIGTSTGGPNALAEVIPRLPEDFPVPVVIVQHMPPLFTRLLAERLHSRSRIPVREAEAGRTLEAGQVWIAPGNHHMTVVRSGVQSKLQLNQDPPENSCRPAVDVLFRSVARSFGPKVLAVVMTGMGSDGARGAAHIREAGGEVFVQDEATSVVWGMPGAAVSAGVVDKICPLTEISHEIVRRIAAGRTQRACMRTGV